MPIHPGYPARPGHPGYVWRLVALYCRITEILALLCVSKSMKLFLIHFVYRDIKVGKSARQMVHSLATNKSLPRIVETLYFSNLLASVDAVEWETVLPALSHLRFLMITPRIPLSQHVLPLITFRLTFFGSISTVDPPWTELVASQHGLERIVCTSKFRSNLCGHQLTLLRTAKGLPSDLATFAFFHRLHTMWFYTGRMLAVCTLQRNDFTCNAFSVSRSRLRALRICAPDFVSLLYANPVMISTLRHLVLDEDLSWSNFKLESDALGLSGSSLADVVVLIDECHHWFQHLESIFLVCSVTSAHRSHRELLTCNDAYCFLKFMSGYCTSPALRKFRFAATDGYATCTGWNEEQIHYLPPSPRPSFLDYYSGLFNDVDEYH
ncbi:hypothetical protein C8R45DRAFT_1107440 [Mycena sanguinolenta]|nr:hypothetical protein C8R45DRAFT_1107440 [Mycena sanguinolenta]